jgi:2-polyprenyl-3-methyl-5-hydroxy-6-metoxy-1,4-benzoquinol methylase
VEWFRDIQTQEMRSIEEIKAYWDNAYKNNYEGDLSGCKYDETIKFLQVDKILKSGDKVLEIGPGMGYVTKGLYENAFTVSTLDISDIGLEWVGPYCERLYNLENIEELPSDYFDVIICHNVIQHIPTYLLVKELPHVISSLKGVFAVEFISSDLAEDTGIIVDCDANVGFYCRTPEYFGKMINSFGGDYKIVFKNESDIAEHIIGSYVFHVTKKK